MFLFSFSRTQHETSGLSEMCWGQLCSSCTKGEIFRKFRSSALLFVYSGVMLLIFLFCRVAIKFGNIFIDNIDNVYTFAAMISFYGARKLGVIADP
jgi:hypothetical protein